MKTPIINSLNKELLQKRDTPNYRLVNDMVFYVHKYLSNHELPIDLSFMNNFHNLKIKTYSWFAKLNHLSIDETIEYVNSDSGCCWFLVNENKYLILYNDFIPNPHHNRWTLAHELGHYLLKHNEICDTAILGRNSLTLGEYKIYEKEANAFASKLLAPLNVICNIFDSFSIIDIMDLCDLSFEASKHIFDFVVNGLQMGISYDCESETTKIFKKFINNRKYSNSCIECNYSFVSLNAKFCPICGSNRLIKEKVKNNMKYNNVYRLDENSKALECPICHNEETADGEYCKICGTFLINRCSNIVEDNWGNQVDGCGKPAVANARYCIYCGSKTTFYLNNLLCDFRNYQSYNNPETILTDNWKSILNNLKSNGKIMLYANLQNTELIALNANEICIEFPNGINNFSEKIITSDENIKLIKKELHILFFHPVDICIKDGKTNRYIYEDKALSHT